MSQANPFHAPLAGLVDLSAPADTDAGAPTEPPARPPVPASPLIPLALVGPLLRLVAGRVEAHRALSETREDRSVADLLAHLTTTAARAAAAASADLNNARAVSEAASAARQLEQARSHVERARAELAAAAGEHAVWADAWRKLAADLEDCRAGLEAAGFAAGEEPSTERHSVAPAHPAEARARALAGRGLAHGDPSAAPVGPGAAAGAPSCPPRGRRGAASARA